MFNNKSILITGGTGSFGNAFVSFIIKNYKPKKLIIFSRDEYKQFKMAEKFPTSKYKFLRFFIGDVRDKNRLKLASKNIDFLIHAAALKQVTTAEYNPQEYINTNILGAQNVSDVAIENNISKVIALSTDKAANPINLYGATKLASDKLFIAANNLVGTAKTRFTVVRYGNVLNSRGSVVPLFKKLSANGEKFLPITHPKMTRFWVSLDDAVKFVNYCFKIMQGGEILIPKIPSVKITDLAKAINPKMRQKIIGIKPGEKLHEIMCPKDSAHLTYEFKSYYLITTDIIFFNRNRNFKKNKFSETGKLVKDGFEYNSLTNINFLNISQIKKLI